MHFATILDTSEDSEFGITLLGDLPLADDTLTAAADALSDTFTQSLPFGGTLIDRALVPAVEIDPFLYS